MSEVLTTENVELEVVYTGACRLSTGKGGHAFVPASIVEGKGADDFKWLQSHRAVFGGRISVGTIGGVYRTMGKTGPDGSILSMHVKDMGFVKRLEGELVAMWELESRAVEAVLVQAKQEQRLRKTPAAMDEIKALALIYNKLSSNGKQGFEAALLGLLRESSRREFYR